MPKVARDLVEYLSNQIALLPEPISMEAAIVRIASLHEEEEGATFNLWFGSLAGQPLHAVSLYPERTVVLPGRAVSPNVLRLFLRDNQDLLRDPRNNVGTWYNVQDDETYLDVSTALPGRETALELATRYNQIVVFDLAARIEVETGGTGEEPVGLPPESERLPTLFREQGDGNDG